MNKRGLEHVEFIVSFVFFVGFLLFALYFFSPLKGDRIVDSTLFYTMDEISANTSVALESLSVVIGPEVSAPVVGIRVDDRQDKGAYVENSAGRKLPSHFNPLREIVFTDRMGERFVIIKFSQDIEQGTLGEGNIVLDSENYTVSSSDSRKVISEKRVIELANTYSTEEGYISLKKEFNLPSRANFGFALIISDSERIEAKRDVPAGLEVFSQRERFEILRSDGSSKFADLEVRVW
ncbi:hypothetical protein CO038_04865 [Candidatus Pacearchaeota archaeon CG_4_9_14_0_2_um_filter_39_13]|nr:hypothetical protein [Candidatus Pacearchaeota archaeon]OIO43690.1 MAG: hypothetical protein AUJ64_01885 [Candidatus Pacearchaeota archaeon CG1_02_39_14]PJC44227.1 MAG: hypothetical protein CO038_04865 [Candidatus Pacearchaeota archaeon CG_4_9_14_0_2_um_filter_39_13]